MCIRDRSRHANGYRSWAGLSKNDNKVPSFGQNLTFFFKYQIGWSYLRYFMWNFAGRQNDVQGEYNILNGNWISGINFIDQLRLGNQSELSEDQKNNKARNTYFFLPLILGIIGLIYCYKYDIKSFWTLLLLFLFTGLALKFYLNERPFEPRERDYSVVGSFYIFCMFIGLGGFYISKIFESLKIRFSQIISFLMMNQQLLVLPLKMKRLMN